MEKYTLKQIKDSLLDVYLGHKGLHKERTLAFKVGLNKDSDFELDETILETLRYVDKELSK